MCGNDDENDGAACTADHENFPMQSSVDTPSAFMHWFPVIFFCIFTTFS